MTFIIFFKAKFRSIFVFDLLDFIFPFFNNFIKPSLKSVLISFFLSPFSLSIKTMGFLFKAIISKVETPNLQ